MAKTFKVKTDSEEFGETTYKVAANSKEEAQTNLITKYPRIAEEDSDPYNLPPGKREVIDSIVEIKGEELEEGYAESVSIDNFF